jgi:hypothetical protein
MPQAAATITSWAMPRRPASAAIGTVASSAARPRSEAIMIGRRRTRSAKAPANNPSNSTAAAEAPLRIPICMGEAPNTM